MILVSKYIVPRGYIGITLFPFVFIKYAKLRENAVLLNHERIHLRQQLELLILPFFVWYGIEFFMRYMRYRNWRMAYRTISFEKEAYARETDLDYLKKRRFWQFLKFM